MSRRNRIGRRNKLLTVQENTATTQDAEGYIDESWVARAEMWCSIKPLEGRELRQSEALLHENPVAIGMRWDSRLEAMEPTAWRLKDVRVRVSGTVTTIYDIVSVVNVNEADVDFELLCTSGSRVPT